MIFQTKETLIRPDWRAVAFWVFVLGAISVGLTCEEDPPGLGNPLHESRP